MGNANVRSRPRRDLQEACGDAVASALEIAALDYFERLGHDNDCRHRRVFGWDDQDFCAGRRVTDDLLNMALLKF